jgi:hypothetical protein
MNMVNPCDNHCYLDNAVATATITTFIAVNHTKKLRCAQKGEMHIHVIEAHEKEFHHKQHAFNKTMYVQSAYTLRKNS